MAFRVIDDDAALQDAIFALLDEPVYAVDTEFHRERTYFPRLALVQIAWPGNLVLVDALAVDLRPLRSVLTGPGMAVIHAADQDLEVLELVCGCVPSRLFDTQIAAGFLGMAFPSLGSLYEHELNIQLPKADRLTDWFARPLTAQQLDYAASDVEHLLEVHDRLRQKLKDRGRLQWALDECEQQRSRDRRRNRDPDEAWRRIKEARQLRGRARSIAQAVAAWRERKAAELDQPVRFILPDLAIVGIAQRPPGSIQELRKIRGLEDRHLRNGMAEELLQAIRGGMAVTPPPTRDNSTKELSRELRPAATLVSAWVSQLARDLEIDAALLATRSDIEAFLRGDDEARLATGWRAELVGEPIRRLVSGDAALAFESGGRLRLESRSHEPLADR
ncbi:MAG: HRDC domain-containing protein [Acidimicrobiales bacterium]|nr:HRDC domain-containing protein [Acidimicrobiales bacterium]